MPKKDNFPSLMRRARWDRLFGTLIILVLLIILITNVCKSCSREPQQDDVIHTNVPASTDEIMPTTEAPSEYPMTVFLSPSTQEDNMYACDESITEQDAMFELAEKVKALLEHEGYTVYMCGENDGVRDKVKIGNELQCGAYVALHTNAGGETGAGEGTECYYNPDNQFSRELAENVYNRVAELTPTEDRGLKDGSDKYYEIDNYHYAACLLEVEFHDSVEYSQWILDHQDATAKAVKDGIIAFLNSRTSAPPEEEPSETSGEDMQ